MSIWAWLKDARLLKERCFSLDADAIVRLVNKHLIRIKEIGKEIAYSFIKIMTIGKVEPWRVEAQILSETVIFRKEVHWSTIDKSPQAE